MRYLRVTLEFPARVRHPMHDFLVTHPEMEREELWSWRFVGEMPAMLFRVVGPLEPYKQRIQDVTTVDDCTLTAVTDNSFYAFVRAEPTSDEWDWILAFAHESIAVLPPVLYTDDGAVSFEVVGEPADLRALLGDLPADVDATVDRLGTDDQRRSPTADITDRQREIVATAVALGYYDVPREATVSDVAAEFDIAPSTVSTHLRKAEATVMHDLIATGRHRDRR
jgi:predicted DNA binding protein